jgi:hypothetical protein
MRLLSGSAIYDPAQSGSTRILTAEQSRTHITDGAHIEAKALGKRDDVPTVHCVALPLFEVDGMNAPCDDRSAGPRRSPAA